MIAVPLLMLLFSRIEGYYARVALDAETRPDAPASAQASESIVVVPTTTVSQLTERAVSAASRSGRRSSRSLSRATRRNAQQIKRAWDDWRPGVPIEVLLDPRRSLVRTVLRYVESIENEGATITVLIPELIPRKRRHEILHNQRGRLWRRC